MWITCFNILVVHTIKRGSGSKALFGWQSLDFTSKSMRTNSMKWIEPIEVTVNNAPLCYHYIWHSDMEASSSSDSTCINIINWPEVLGYNRQACFWWLRLIQMSTLCNSTTTNTVLWQHDLIWVQHQVWHLFSWYEYWPVCIIVIRPLPYNYT